MKRRTRPGFVLYSVRMEVGKLVKVKAHKRVCNGKTVKVRSHYRRY